MSETERYYYLLEVGSKEAAIVTEFNREFYATQKRSAAFCDEFGAVGSMGNTFGIQSLIFADKRPEGWRDMGEESEGLLARPYARKKDDKKIIERMRELKQLDARDLTQRFTGSCMTFFVGMSILYVTFDSLGDGTVVVSIPDTSKTKWKPGPGLIPLKHSEYWTLKEADECDREDVLKSLD